MTAQKRILASLAGCIVLFLTGWLFYGYLFSDFFDNNAGSATGVMKEDGEMLMWALVVGNLLQAYLLVYVFGKWANINTLMRGLTSGIILGLIIGYGFAFVGYATSNNLNLTAALVDPLIYAAMYGLAGGVIAWVLGYNKS